MNQVTVRHQVLVALCGFRDIPRATAWSSHLGAAPQFPDGCHLLSGLGSSSLLETNKVLLSLAWGSQRCHTSLQMASPIHTRLDLSGASLPGPRGEGLLFHRQQRGWQTPAKFLLGSRGTVCPEESSHSILASCLPSIQLLFFNTPSTPEIFLGEEMGAQGARSSASSQPGHVCAGQTQATLGAKKAPHSPVSVWERENPDQAWASEYLES